jgi:hypothetical protein
MGQFIPVTKHLAVIKHVACRENMYVVAFSQITRQTGGTIGDYGDFNHTSLLLASDI